MDLWAFHQYFAISNFFDWRNTNNSCNLFYSWTQKRGQVNCWLTLTYIVHNKQFNNLIFVKLYWFSQCLSLLLCQWLHWIDRSKLRILEHPWNSGGVNMVKINEKLSNDFIIQLSLVLIEIIWINSIPNQCDYIGWSGKLIKYKKIHKWLSFIMFIIFPLNKPQYLQLELLHFPTQRGYSSFLNLVLPNNSP